MKHREVKDIGKIFREGVLIDEAMRKAAQEAIWVHKQAGVPLVVWRDGRIAMVDADEFEKTLKKKQLRDARKK